MKMIKGRMGWMPTPLLEEINNIKKAENIDKDSKAIGKIIKYSKKGREYANLPLDFNEPIRFFKRKKK